MVTHSLESQVQTSPHHNTHLDFVLPINVVMLILNISEVREDNVINTDKSQLSFYRDLASTKCGTHTRSS